MGNSKSVLITETSLEPKSARTSMGNFKIKSYRSEAAFSTEPGDSMTPSPTLKLTHSKDSSLAEFVNFDAPKAKILSRKKSHADTELIKKTLSQHFIFSHLPEENLEKIIKRMNLYSLEANNFVFYQGNPGYMFFIIASGSVEMIVNGVPKAILTTGQGFGDLALIHETTRTSTIRTIEKVEMWAIDRIVFLDSLRTLNSLKFEENKIFLTSVPFLQTLSNSQIESLLLRSVTQSFNHGEKIISEGDPGSIFYIIQEGSVECSSNGKVFRRLTKGEYFGEQAVLYDINRSATVAAVNKVTVLSFGREILFSTLGHQLNYILYKNSLRIAFDSCEYLKGLNTSQKEAIINSVEIFQFNKNETVIPKGAVKNRYLWIVLKGSICAGFREVNRFRNVGAKWMYCEKDGLVGDGFIANVDVDVGIIKTSQVEEIIGGKLAEKVQENFFVEILNEVPIFKTISKSKLILMANKLKTVEYADNQTIFLQGDAGDSFYIIKEGEINICKDSKVIRTLLKGNYFGERSILLNEPRTASAITKTKAALWVLSREDFLEIIDDNLISLLQKRMNLQDDSTTLADLVVVNKLGKGSFGNVYLCVKKQNRFLYALKVISRKKIEFYKLQEFLKIEKRVMQVVEHQFIVKFVKSFVDSKRVYFLLEYIQGVSFYDVLRTIGLTGTLRCRFYASCLLLILEHLHENSLIYRDLKPENIMVESDGYLKLLDFGTAKHIAHKTYTVIGTPHYMAPEVILSKGYNKSVDLWALGIILYEMLCGYVPFGKDEEDPISIYKQIIKGKYNFPQYVKQDSIELIQLLLSPNPTDRGLISGLKNNKWFAGVEWENILNRTKNSPFKPEVESLDEVVDYSLEQNALVETFLCKNREENESFVMESIDKYISADWDKDF